MRKSAISAAMPPTESRLHARYLWKVPTQNAPAMPVIETEGLNDNACATLGWHRTQLGHRALILETKCLNLYRSGACEEAHQPSGSGAEGDMLYDGTIRGGFALVPDGLLSREVPPANKKIVYPATIQLR